MADRVQDSLHTLLTWFLSPKSQGLMLDGAHAVKMMAQHIALGYERLRIDLPLAYPDIVEVEALDKTDYLGVDSDYLKPVLQLKEFAKLELQGFLIDFLIHGSLATLDYSKGWSDFDTFLIVNEKTICDPAVLIELRAKLLEAYPLLLQIDSLQHHGFLLCAESDLRHYNSIYMPVEVLRESKSYFGNKTYTINVLNTRRQERQIFLKRIDFFKRVYETGILKHHAYKGEYLLSHYRNAENGLYQFKYFLNYIAIIPSYYFGALGTHYYKRDTISRIRPLLNSKYREFIDKASYIRAEWPNRENFPYYGNQIPEWVQHEMGPDYFKQIYEFIAYLGQNLETSLRL